MAPAAACWRYLICFCAAPPFLFFIPNDYHSQHASATAACRRERTLSMATLAAFGWSLPFGGMLKSCFCADENSGRSRCTRRSVEIVGEVVRGGLLAEWLGYVEVAQSENDAAGFGFGGERGSEWRRKTRARHRAKLPSRNTEAQGVFTYHLHKVRTTARCFLQLIARLTRSLQSSVSYIMCGETRPLNHQNSPPKNTYDLTSRTRGQNDYRQSTLLACDLPRKRIYALDRRLPLP